MDIIGRRFVYRIVSCIEPCRLIEKVTISLLSEKMKKKFLHRSTEVYTNPLTKLDMKVDIKIMLKLFDI